MKGFKIGFLTVVLFLTGGIMNAQTIKVSLEEKAFALKDKDGKDLEPSAIEPLNDKYFLVADDKGANLYIVEAGKEKVLQKLEIKGFTVKKPKWEALTLDGEYFYIIGSHAVKLDPKDSAAELTDKLAARSHLLRFKLKNTDGDPSKFEIDSWIELNVSESLKADGYYDSVPNKNKVKIEGLSVRTNAAKRKELVFALREPSDLMYVFSAELPAEPKTGERLAPKPFFSFGAGKIGAIPFRLSSIEYAPLWNGFFMLTSTEDSATNAFFGNALWFVGDETLKSSKQVVPQLVHLFAVDMKAEGLCILPDAKADKLRLALVFDNDADDTKIVGKMQIIEVSKK